MPARRISRWATMPCSMHIARSGTRRPAARTAQTTVSASTPGLDRPRGTAPKRTARSNDPHKSTALALARPATALPNSRQWRGSSRRALASTLKGTLIALDRRTG